MQSLGFEVTLSRPFEAAVETVTEALKAEGFGVLTRIDVRETLKDKLGVDFRPYTILGACNPPLAHRALSADSQVGLMMPCNVTVEATEGGQCLVRLGDPEILMGGSGMEAPPELRQVATEAKAKLQKVARSLGS